MSFIPRVTDAERLEAVALVREIYASPDGGAGCCLHCILDDGNTEDAFVKSYDDEPGTVKHDNCRRLLALLKKMKRTQREKVIRQGKGWT